MRLKKLVAIALCAVTAVSCCFSSACNNQSSGEAIRDGKTVNIMMQLSGWGTDYIRDVAKKFEEAYAEEGYKINFIEPRSTFQGSSALSEIRLGWEKNGYDIVIPGGVSIKQGLDPEYGEYIADISDVFDSPAINYDRSEASETIGSLFDDNQTKRLKYNGKFYGFGMSSGARGLVYNQKVLAKYGIDKAPITTDELFEQYDIILNGTETVRGMRPTTWGGDNASAYSFSTLYSGMAQLIGVDAYDDFFYLDYMLNEDGTIDKDGYKFYEQYEKEIEAVLEVVIKKYDVLYSHQGSKEQKHNVAHAQLVTGKSAFMQDGEYFYNEVQFDFPTYLNDIRMAPTPIISYLGTMLKLDGTGADAEKCDDILSYMCELYDNGADNATIKSQTESKFAITLTDDQVAKVVEARGVSHADTAGGIYVIKGSPVQDISKLFLRMLASSDAAKTVSKYGMMHAMYPVDISEYPTQFTKDCAKIAARRTYNTTSALLSDTVRANTNMFLIPPYNALLPVTLNNEMGVPESGDVKDRDYKALANTTTQKILSTTKDTWAELCAQGGYKLG